VDVRKRARDDVGRFGRRIRGGSSRYARVRARRGDARPPASRPSLDAKRVFLFNRLFPRMGDAPAGGSGGTRRRRSARCPSGARRGRTRALARESRSRSSRECWRSVRVRRAMHPTRTFLRC